MGWAPRPASHAHSLLRHSREGGNPLGGVALPSRWILALRPPPVLGHTRIFRHSREGGNPLGGLALPSRWIPAFAGMTTLS